MLVVEDGPWYIFDRIRVWTGVKLAEGAVEWPSWNPLHCIWCTSMWIAPIIYGLWMVAHWLVWILAISAVACLIEAWNNGKSDD